MVSRTLFALSMRWTTRVRGGERRFFVCILMTRRGTDENGRPKHIWERYGNNMYHTGGLMTDGG